MSQSVTWDTLRGPAHDAFELARAADAKARTPGADLGTRISSLLEAWTREAEGKAILEEIESDLTEHARLTRRKVLRRPFFYTDGEDEDGEYVERPMTADEARAERLEVVAANRRIDWLAWERSGSSLDTTAINEILKEHCTDDRVREMSTTSNSFLSILRRTEPSDGFEARIGAYANTITWSPHSITVVDVE